MASQSSEKVNLQRRWSYKLSTMVCSIHSSQMTAIDYNLYNDMAVLSGHVVRLLTQRVGWGWCVTIM